MTEQHPSTPADDAAGPAAPHRRIGTRARWVAGLGGLAVAAAIAVPAVASAATPAGEQTGSTPAASCAALDRATARATSAPLVRDYLAAHADLNAELTTVRAMPKDQRRGELTTYFAAHADEKAGLKTARAAEVALHQACR